MDVSVIVPAYNQSAVLPITLRAFSSQKTSLNWELLLVDDGSTDDTLDVMMRFSARFACQVLQHVHIGRAAARNAGIVQAQGDIVIFCDGDRAPGTNFVQSHCDHHTRYPNSIVIGDIAEFYFSRLATRRDALLVDAGQDFQSHARYARRPAYPRVVYSMFNEAGICTYAMPWLAFFSGNVSIKKNHIQFFDESFTKWGFEHFELGYRLHKSKLSFLYNSDARNYHFAHPRPLGFYDEMIKESHHLFFGKHPHKDVELLITFLYGEISLQEYHNLICEQYGKQKIPESSPIFYNQLISK